MDIDIVKILGVGISGFGLLLMYLVYNLIVKIINNPNVAAAVVSMIKFFMILCVLMTLAVGSFTYMATIAKNDLIAQQSATIDTNKQTVSALVAAQKYSVLTDSLTQPKSDANIAVVRQEQKKALDTITKYVTTSNNKPLIDTFNKYKNIVTNYPAAVAAIDPADTKKTDSIKLVYKQARFKINAVSLKVSEAKIKQSYIQR